MAKFAELQFHDNEVMQGNTSRLVVPKHQEFSTVVPKNGLAPSLERSRLRSYLLLLIGDVVILVGSFYGVAAAYFGSTSLARLDSGMLSAYVILPLFLTIALYNGTYSRGNLTNWQSAVLKAGTAIMLSATLLNLLTFVLKTSAELSRFVFLVGLAASFSLMIAMRFAVARALRRKWGSSLVNRLVIHAGGEFFKLPETYHVDATQVGLFADTDDPHALDKLARYLRNMDEVVVSCRDEDRPAWAEVLRGVGVHGELVHKLSRDIGATGVIHHDDIGISTLRVSSGRLGMRSRAAKRIFDVSVAMIATLVLFPFFLLVAALIKIEDGGPIFFKQRRIGRGNRFFSILKFRSMREGDEDGSRSTERDDARVTRVGQWIRRTSIDELPQLLNVLAGDMSMVGPRPHALGSKAGDKLFWHVDRNYWQRHGLRPGITGLAQIRGYRGATDTESDLRNRLLSDLEYVDRWSMLRDIGILLSTVKVVTHSRAF